MLSYAVVGTLAGYLGALIAVEQTSLYQQLAAISDWLIAAILLVGGLVRAFPTLRLCQLLGRIYHVWLGALLFGILTGFTICPPLVAAVVAVFANASAWNGLIYFSWFYLGTSAYFLPFFGVSTKLFNNLAVKNVARLVMLLMSGYFLLKAIAASL